MTKRLAAPLAVLLGALALAAACSSGVVDNVPPDATILLDREDVHIAAYVKTQQNVSLQILNKGRHPLTVSNIHLELVDGGALPGNSVYNFPDGGTSLIVAVDAGSVSDPLPVVIGGLGTGFVQFKYSPQSPGKSLANLVVDDDAAARAQVVVPVTGCATYIDGGGANCGCAADAGADSGC